MTWYERMNAAIEYIESNIYNSINFDEIAKIVGQSAINFQRTFSIVTDISVFEYIRRRRLTLAAFDIQNTNDKVIDVALKHGYESPEAFTRAFKEMHGTSPTNARKQALALKAYPRITFLLSIKGAEAMEYRVEQKEAFSVYGIEAIFTTEDDEMLKNIPVFWKECWESGKCGELLKSTGGPTSGIHAVCGYRKTGGNTFPYMIFTRYIEGCNTDGFTKIEIPESTWAIFKSENHTMEQTSSVIQNLIKRAHTDWLPSASYKKIDGYELELTFCLGDNIFYSEVWMRVAI